MIVRELREGLALFDQQEHARLSGEMARAWGRPPFAAVPEEVVVAARVHDDGWPEWDRHPRLDPRSGRPHDYTATPPDDYLEVWERGVERGWSRGDLAGLLVSLHGCRFFRRKKRPPERAFLLRERRRQAGALARLGLGATGTGLLPEPVGSWHEWLYFWDGLSLFLCHGWPSPWRSGVESSAGTRQMVARRSGKGAVLSPFPFSREVRLEARARLVPERQYPDQAALDHALDSAKERTFTYTLAAG
ncbi:MAG: DUF3891 family protein [Longimicrobiaceae bacterium]